MSVDRDRRRYTVVATHLHDDYWHIDVGELPESWTVAFSEGEIEARARARIALDTGAEPDEFDVEVLRVRQLARAH